MSPSFRGPRQITGASLSGSMKPIDITAKLSSRKTGDHPVLLLCTSLPSKPSMRGTLGPQMSMSSMPTSTAVSYANVSASYVATVDFPTPPFPERTSITFLTSFSLFATSSSAERRVTATITYLDLPSLLRHLHRSVDSGILRTHQLCQHLHF